MASPKFKECKIGLTKIKTLAPPMVTCNSHHRINVVKATINKRSYDKLTTGVPKKRIIKLISKFLLDFNRKIYVFAKILFYLQYKHVIVLRINKNLSSILFFQDLKI